MAIKFTDKKFYKYIYLRLIRQSGTPYSLALGVAIGIFSGFVLPLFQMFLAFFLAWVFKTNKIVAIASTWISNPFTYAIIFPLNVYVGGFFIPSDFDMELFEQLSLSTLFTDFTKVLYFFVSDGMLMFMTGGAIVGGTIGLLLYGIVYSMITRHREEKKERFFKRREFLKKKTGISN